MPIAISNLTGVPLYDNMAEGFLYVPGLFADWIGAYDINVGFWMGIVIFFGCVLVFFRLVFGWD